MAAFIRTRRFGHREIEAVTRVTKVEKKDDSGLTLIEMMVAMAIFTVLLSIFGVAVQSFSRSTVRTLQTSDQTTQSRVVFDRFDKQVRSASAISVPGKNPAGVNWYVEYQDDTVVPSTCTQWVLRTDTGKLETREWAVGALTAPAWRPVAAGITNTPTQPPFDLIESTTIVQLQQLSVSLRYQRGTGPLTVNTSVFAARNSTTVTVTNIAGGEICNSSTWRP
jgi:prepilin-type N-terminal cleavage/methylation domain-containing protein